MTHLGWKIPHNIIQVILKSNNYAPKAKHSFGRITETKTVFDAFGYNSAESEPIFMKSGAPWVHCWKLALILGAIRVVATIWEGAEIICQVNDARFRRFPVG